MNSKDILRQAASENRLRRNERMQTPDDLNPPGQFAGYEQGQAMVVYLGSDQEIPVRMFSSGAIRKGDVGMTTEDYSIDFKPPPNNRNNRDFSAKGDNKTKRRDRAGNTQVLRYNCRNGVCVPEADGVFATLDDCVVRCQPTSSPSPTPAPSPSPTPAPSPSPTPAPTPSPTPSPTPEPTPSPTPSPTPEPTPTPTPTPAPTPSPTPGGCQWYVGAVYRFGLNFSGGKGGCGPFTMEIKEYTYNLFGQVNFTFKDAVKVPYGECQPASEPYSFNWGIGAHIFAENGVYPQNIALPAYAIQPVPPNFTEPSPGYFCGGNIGWVSVLHNGQDLTAFTGGNPGPHAQGYSLVSIGEFVQVIEPHVQITLKDANGQTLWGTWYGAGSAADFELIQGPAPQ